MLQAAVISAKAGTHSANLRKCAVHGLDSRFRGNDRHFVWDDTSNDTTTVDVAPTKGKRCADVFFASAALWWRLWVGSGLSLFSGSKDLSEDNSD